MNANNLMLTTGIETFKPKLKDPVLPQYLFELSQSDTILIQLRKSKSKMSNRFGEAHKKMPYCLRQLPENRPRNRQEFMIRKRMIPEDPDMYFDDARRFLYDSSCMAEELERLKRFRTQSLGLVRKQTEYLKSMILKKKTTQEADIAKMKERFKKAQADHAKALGDVKGKGKKRAAKTASSTSVSSSPSSSRQ